MKKSRLVLLFCLCIFIGLAGTVFAQDAIAIEYGDSVSGEVVDTDSGTFYVFQGEAGETVTVAASSDSVDVYIQLGDSGLNIITENDDISADNFDSELTFELPADGDYYIFVGAYQPGEYTLSLEVEGGAAAPPAQAEGDMAYGDTVSGEVVDDETPVVFTFVGGAGDTVIVSAESTEIDTYLVLADSSGSNLAENDDISQDNFNSYLEAVLPANGQYLIGVFGYQPGAFSMSLALSGSDAPVPVVDSGPVGDLFTGDISAETTFVEFPLTGVAAGSTITLDVQATSGDLDPYVGLIFNDQVVAENDDRTVEDKDSLLEYRNAEAGDYVVVVTRYGFADGETSGSFQLALQISTGSGALANNTQTDVPDPVASGYPEISPQPVADWTILAYYGGDNNLEDGALFDMDEFERAGGSTDSVRIVVLMDRSEEYDTSNDDWTDTRIFEIGPDISGDANSVYPPTVDSQPLAILGELDTSYVNNLTEFLVWGMAQYPAERYAISINDHGGAWTGIVTDDRSGHGEILTVPELQQAFSVALREAGLEKFDLMINDACLMSSVEYYAAMSPYFNYVLSSPEVQIAPGFDMTLLTNSLNDNPDIDLRVLGETMADKYMADMNNFFADTAPVLGASFTDLTKFDGVVDAVNAFAAIANSNPDAYASLFGRARANTYTYSFFLPEDQYGPATNIDLGDFMNQIISLDSDPALSAAAQDVIAALDNTRVYGSSGGQLGNSTSYYNIYFPESLADSDGNYSEQNPLVSWTQFLVNYYQAVTPGGGIRGIRSAGAPSPGGGLTAAPSIAPQVAITNVFPTETSIAFPTTVSMEVVGRNISHGDFTVDRIDADGTIVRLDRSRIVTTVVEDGIASQINFWNPGVDDSDFTWEVELSVISDGTIESYELVETSDSVSSIAGQYRFPGSEEWLQVTILFDDGGVASSVLNRQPGSTALASIRLEAGGEFQTYRSVVTPDGRLDNQPGTIFTWPEEGIRFFTAPAPSGQYNLGFYVEAFGGLSGFGATTVTVNNDTTDESLRGYVDDDWGFTFQRPVDWFNVNFFPNDTDGFLQTNDIDETEYIFVYPVYGATGDLEAIANEVIGRYTVETDGTFTPITVAGRDALEFTFTYGSDQVFNSRAFAIFVPDLELGLVFSSEAVDAAQTEANYQTVLDSLTFFDPVAAKASDTGAWERDFYTDFDRYSVPRTWMPGFEGDLFWFYTPDGSADSLVFAGVSALVEGDDDPATVLTDILAQQVEELPGYTLLNRETYYGENNTWEMAVFTHQAADGTLVVGRMYASVKHNIPYLLWFEAPENEFEGIFRSIFTVMLDSFRIDEEEADSE